MYAQVFWPPKKGQRADWDIRTAQRREPKTTEYAVITRWLGQWTAFPHRRGAEKGGAMSTDQKLAAACTFIMVPMPGMFGMGGLAVRGLSFALWGVANG